MVAAGRGKVKGPGAQKLVKETEGLECLLCWGLSSSQEMRDMEAQFSRHTPPAKCYPSPVSFQQAFGSALPPGTNATLATLA